MERVFSEWVARDLGLDDGRGGLHAFIKNLRTGEVRKYVLRQVRFTEEVI